MSSPRLLIVPGLQDSGPAHWQSWLQGQYRDSLRVRQRNWGEPDLDRWAARIATTLEHAGDGRLRRLPKCRYHCIGDGFLEDPMMGQFHIRMIEFRNRPAAQ